jgi:hypothetical protein
MAAVHPGALATGALQKEEEEEHTARFVKFPNSQFKFTLLYSYCS